MPTAAVADESVSFVSGVVRADANKNNAVDTSELPGLSDLGVAGVKVTLECVTPTDPKNVGWTTATDADGAWDFPSSIDVSEKCAANSDLFVSIDTKGVTNDAYAVHSIESDFNKFSAVAGKNQQARSAPFSANAVDQELNALIWPVWKLDIRNPNDSNGLGGSAVFTGSAPI